MFNWGYYCVLDILEHFIMYRQIRGLIIKTIYNVYEVQFINKPLGAV